MQGLIKCGLFLGLSKKEMKVVEEDFREVQHDAGEAIMEKGRKGLVFMVVLEGKAEVLDGRRVVAVLGPGDHFGEMALLDKAGRSANVRARTNVRLAALPEWEFEGFMLKHPLVTYRLAQTLTKRLRAAQA
jgi:CRP/FNR family cyclic AMP-dependent transcriptional regulator